MQKEDNMHEIIDGRVLALFFINFLLDRTDGNVQILDSYKDELDHFEYITEELIKSNLYLYLNYNNKKITVKDYLVEKVLDRLLVEDDEDKERTEEELLDIKFKIASYIDAYLFKREKIQKGPDNDLVNGYILGTASELLLRTNKDYPNKLTYGYKVQTVPVKEEMKINKFYENVIRDLINGYVEKMSDEERKQTFDEEDQTVINYIIGEDELGVSALLEDQYTLDDYKHFIRILMGAQELGGEAYITIVNDKYVQSIINKLFEDYKHEKKGSLSNAILDNLMRDIKKI